MPTQRQLQLAADEDLDLVERDWYCASLILQAMGDDEQEATLAAMTREEPCGTTATATVWKLLGDGRE